MEKKKLSIELPKGGMSDLTKQVRNNPIIEPLADATEWQRFTHYQNVPKSTDKIQKHLFSPHSLIGHALVCQRNPKASVGTGDVPLCEKVDVQGLRFLPL